MSLINECEYWRSELGDDGIDDNQVLSIDNAPPTVNGKITTKPSQIGDKPTRRGRAAAQTKGSNVGDGLVSGNGGRKARGPSPIPSDGSNEGDLARYAYV